MTTSAIMREGPPEPAEELDPRLEAFLQKAAPILAVERGINAKSRVLLGAVARDLGLSDAELDDAIKSLQHGGKDSAKSADPAVDAFYRYLHARLEKFNGILTLDLQHKAVDVAADKFQVDEEAARQAIADVAAELRVRRITVADAERHVAGLIAQKLGDAAWLDDQTMERLRASGREWGLNARQVDAVVRKHMLANRESQKKEHRFVAAAAMASGIVVIFLVGFFVWAFVVRPMGSSQAPAQPAAGDEVASTAPVRPPAPAVSPPVISQPAAWWDSQLMAQQLAARREIPDYGPIYDGLCSPDAARRGEAYQQLVAACRDQWNDEAKLRKLQELIVLCHTHDPDEQAAGQLRMALLAWTRPEVKTLPDSSAVYLQAWWAVRTACWALKYQGLSSERAERLAGDLARTVGTTIDAAAARQEIERQCVPAIAATVYHTLAEVGTSAPLDALRLQQEIAKVIDRFVPLDVLNQLQADFLVALLPAAGDQWIDFQHIIDACLLAKNPLIKLKLVKLFESTSQRTLQIYLGRNLLDLTGARPKSGSVEDIAAAIRESLGVSVAPEPQTAQDRWTKLLPLAGEALGRTASFPSQQRQLMEETVELAWLASLASALAQQEPGFPLFDQLLEAGKPPLAPVKTEDESEEPEEGSSPTRTPPPLSQSFLKRMDGYFDSLAQYQKVDSLTRQSHLRGLARDADRLPQIKPQQGYDVALYLLAGKTEQEQSRILDSVEAVSRWTYVRLALADLIADSPLSDAMAAQVISKALRREIVPEGPNWREAARQQLLRDVQAELQTRAGDGKDDAGKGDELDLGAAVLQRLYRERARQLRVDPGVYEATKTPSQTLALLVGQTQAQLSAGGTNLSWLAPRMRVIDYVSSYDLERTVALQRVWLKLLALEIRKLGSQQAGQADELVRGLEQRDARASHLLSQLRDGEETTLRMWLLYAPKTMEK